MRKKSKLRNTTKKVKSVRVTADDAVKHSTGIMAEREDPIRERLMKVAGLLRPILSAEDRETLDRCLALYDRNEFVIMVAGEISVGKSSFLNALIGQSILLTDATETTAAITYLRSAEGVPDVKPDHVKITYKDGRVEWIDMHDHKRMLAATTSLDGNKKAISRVKMAEVFLSRKTLDIPRGITIIDTPGLNGSDSHSDLTHREMGLCHVALYLLDATKFGTSSNEREFGKLYRYAPEVLFVVNKWDLVRATGCDLRKMKSETYFPKLGNWAKDGEVSDANIFVVSGSEALTAREQYFERRKKEDRLHPNQRTKFTDRDCLPSPDNEYFDLEGRLQEIMRDSEMSKLIRRRPIQTLSELVRQQLERIEQREKQLMAEDEDLKRKLDLEKMRVRQGKDAAEKAFNEVRDFAARLWEIEDRAYRETLADGIKKLQEVVGAEIDELAPSVLQSEVGQKKLASFVRKKVGDLLRMPIQDRFEAFVEFLQKQLESQTEIKAGAGVSISSAKVLEETVSDFNEQRMQIDRQMKILGPKRDGLLSAIAEKKKLLTKVESRMAELKLAEASYEELVNECKEIEDELRKLGPRPCRERKYKSVTRTRRVPGGICRRVLSFFTFGLVDDEVDEEYTTTVEYYDDSKGKKWDERNSRVAAKLKEARARRDGARPDGHEKVRLLKEKQKAQGDIDRLSIELQRLDEEIVEQRRKMRQMSGDRLKQTVAQSWRAEIVRIGAEFEQAIAGFRNDISSFLDVYWQGRTERVEAYIAGLLNNEREVAVRQKMASDAYRKMVADKRVFDRVAGELASELKALT